MYRWTVFAYGGGFPAFASCISGKSRNQRNKSSQVFYQYNLTQAPRIHSKVKQRVILFLGSDKELRGKKTRDIVLNTLKYRIFQQSELLPHDIPEKLAFAYYEK